MYLPSYGEAELVPQLPVDELEREGGLVAHNFCHAPYLPALYYRLTFSGQWLKG
jgi:hypothetical protein